MLAGLAPDLAPCRVHRNSARPCVQRGALQVLNMQRLVIVLGVLLAFHQASADETIQLIDKTKIVGALVHYFDGVLHVRLPNGTTLQLPASKVQQVLFKLPKPRQELSTPAKTFDRLRQAAQKGDLQAYVDCHSAYYQMFLNHQIAMAKPEEFAGRLKKEWGGIQLEVVGTTTKGDTAVMKVRRKKGTESEEGEMRFVRENGEWKMILPL
jgi:hypothetical protein